jgi:hypothetical protein
MPPEARVAIYEPAKSFIDNFKFELEQSGHTVVGVATSVEEGAVLTPRLEELGVNVILLGDSLLDPVMEGYEPYKPLEAMMAEGIKASLPDIQIVDVSSRGDTEGADYHVSKSAMIDRRHRVNIGDFVTKIPLNP